MKFVVRYWSSLLPHGIPEPGAEPPWVDYSVHPASKLGLHNALLAVHDRNEILDGYGGFFECAVFLVVDGKAEKLSAERADKLFKALPHGEIKWLDLCKCLLPPRPQALPPPAATPPVPDGQLALFEHVHTPYDDLEQPRHYFDADV